MCIIRTSSTRLYVGMLYHVEEGSLNILKGSRGLRVGNKMGGRWTDDKSQTKDRAHFFLLFFFSTKRVHIFDFCIVLYIRGGGGG